MQTLKIDLGFSTEPPAFYCPFTGENLLDNDGFEKAAHNMLIAIVWTVPYEPFHAREEILEKYIDLYAEREKDPNEESNPTKILESLLKNTNCLNFEVTYGGMGCGPVWETLNFVYLP